jgi:hypothetical protein
VQYVPPVPLSPDALLGPALAATVTRRCQGLVKAARRCPCYRALRRDAAGGGWPAGISDPDFAPAPFVLQAAETDRGERVNVQYHCRTSCLTAASPQIFTQLSLQSVWRRLHFIAINVRLSYFAAARLTGL